MRVGLPPTQGARRLCQAGTITLQAPTLHRPLAPGAGLWEGTGGCSTVAALWSFSPSASVSGLISVQNKQKAHEMRRSYKGLMLPPTWDTASLYFFFLPRQAAWQSHPLACPNWSSPTPFICHWEKMQKWHVWALSNRANWHSTEKTTGS